MKLVRLRDIAELGSGGTPKRSVTEYFGPGTPWLSIADLNDDIVYTAKESLTDAGLANSSAKVVPPGTLLVAMYGSIGKLGITAREVCTSQAIAFVKPDVNRVDPRFLFHFLLRSRTQLHALGRGGTQMNISQADLKAFEVPLPGLGEQQRIAAILDQADAVRAKRRQVLAHLDVLPQVLFRQLMSEQHASDWAEVRVKDAGEVLLGRQRAPKYQTGKWARPYVRVANVHRDRLELSDVLSMDFDPIDFQTYRLQYGDILLNEGQSTELVGRPAQWREEIEDCCFQNTLLRFRADREVINPEFALQQFVRLLDDGTFAKLSSKTSSVAHLGKSRFSAMLLTVPPMSIQEDFASRVDSLRTRKTKVASALARDDELFASLQARAFRGEL